MVYSFARVSAVVGMRVEDYYQQGKRWWRIRTPRRSKPKRDTSVPRKQFQLVTRIAWSPG